MSPNFLYLLFWFCVSVEITSSTTVVTTSLSLSTHSVESSQSTASSAQTSIRASVSSSPTSSVQGTEKIVGLVVAYLVALVTVVAILFLISRMQMNPTKGPDGDVSTIWAAAAAQTAGPEVGITHQAFVGDSANPINVNLEPENAGFTDTAF
ncbi:hypothetical protein ACROYT_G026612 [Oculina patagonica]